MINIEQALKTPGYMTPEELTYLAEQASIHYRIVELGSFRGRSARALADNLSQYGRLWCVDTWLPEDPSLPLSKAFAEEIADKPDGWLLEDFLRNMEGTKGDFTYVRRTTVEAAADFFEAVEFSEDAELFDMVFIDADHTYDSVKQDILAWKRLIKPGGLICGHDYDPKYWPGVVAAVNEVLPEARPVAGTIWSLTT